MTNYFIEAEKARSGRSTCRGCGSIIEKGALRIADSYEEDHYQNHPWHHAQCLKKLSKRHVDTKLEQVVGYQTLGAEDQAAIKEKIQECQNALKQGKPKKTKAKSKKKRQSSEQSNEEPPKKQVKGKKEKLTKKAIKVCGYSAKERKQFQINCEQFAKFNSDALKSLLAINNQPKTGSKTQLVEKCADGKLLGAIPKCTQCGGGRPRFHNISGEYKCPGFMEDDQFKRCSKVFQRDEITRDPWVQS